MHPESSVLESFLDPIPNLPNFLNPNHVMNTLKSPWYTTSLPARSCTAISANAFACYPCYPASPPPPLSSSYVSTVAFILSSSIIPRPSLPLWSCISDVSPSLSFLPFPHLYHRRPCRTCHLLFRCHYPLRLLCRHFCLGFIVLCILLSPPLIIFCHRTAHTQPMYPSFHISTSHHPASILPRSILPYL